MAALILLFISTGAIAQPKDHARVRIPSHAVELAPGLFYLGTAVENGVTVEGYAILMKDKSKKNFAKPVCNNNDVCDPGENPSCKDCKTSDELTDSDTSACYDYTRSVNWDIPEPYMINPSNTSGLDDSVVIAIMEDSIGKWESAADVKIVSELNVTDEVLDADTRSPDGKNEVFFADVEDANAIGITIVWGVFKGAPASRRIVEWDQVYDDFDYDWSDDCLHDDCSTKMDFENIATHELGHTIGVWDLYTAECSEQTMYGYAGYGETNKRSLEAGDINGAYLLYR
jgi:hypothetical protein